MVALLWQKKMMLLAGYLGIAEYRMNYSTSTLCLLLFVYSSAVGMMHLSYELLLAGS
jgi:hypothetical protein